jgi:hypothetical protein
MDCFFPCIYNLFCRVGVKLSTVEVRYKNLRVEAWNDQFDPSIFFFF